MKTNTNEKRISICVALCLTLVAAFGCFCFADNPDFEGITSPIISLINSLLGPLLAVVGAVGSLYCVLLGVKYAKAEEPQEREKAKQHLKSAIIGFLLIFILIALLNMLSEPMLRWANNVKAN